MIAGWEKFERFFDTVKPIDVHVYGKLSVEAEAWVRQFGVVSMILEESLLPVCRPSPAGRGAVSRAPR